MYTWTLTKENQPTLTVQSSSTDPNSIGEYQTNNDTLYEYISNSRSLVDINSNLLTFGDKYGYNVSVTPSLEEVTLKPPPEGAVY